MRADRRYYVNADRSRVVDEGSPEAALLLAAEGDDISPADVRRYGLGAPKKAADDEAPAADGARAEDAPAETKAVDGPPENKARARGAAKADEGR